MNIMDLIFPLAVLGGLGLLFGVGLSYAGIFFHVEVDPKVESIKAELPGANCGGCGFVGCESFAIAVVKGEAKANGCTAGGERVNQAISEILGVEAEIRQKQVAFNHCGGGTSNSQYRYDYEGINDCLMAMQLAGGGPKACKYGCLGYGNCVRKCNFGAIEIVDGIAVIDKEKCVECGQCISACPKNLIDFIAYDKTAIVKCFSHDSGKEVRENCSVGCIGCKICEKKCEYDAIHVEDNLAKIDYDKCTGCNKCVEACPMKCILPSGE